VLTRSANSAESEPTSMKSGLLAHCRGLAPADFGRNLERQPGFFCHVNNARLHRFPVGKILRHLNITTSIATEFWKFYRKGLTKGSFFQKTRKILLTKFPCLVTSGRHNYTMITDRRKFTTKLTLYGISSFLSLESIQSHSPGLYVPHKKVSTQMFGNVRCPILRIKTNIRRRAGAAWRSIY